MLINGQERFSADKHYAHSPSTLTPGATFQKGTAQDAADAVVAAKAAFPAWSRMNWEERVFLLRKLADIIDERIYEISAAMALEVGGNRMESLGEVAETADLIRYALRTNGSQRRLHPANEQRPALWSLLSTNQSVLVPLRRVAGHQPLQPGRPDGRSCRRGAAAGNTVVMKPATRAGRHSYWQTACARRHPRRRVQFRHRSRLHAGRSAD